MSWATHAIEKLGTGVNAVIYPRGNSMIPLVKSGAEVELEPVVDTTELSKGDIVLVKVSGRVYLHLIKAVGKRGYQIGNNRGGINGWTNRSNVFGRVVRVEENQV